MKRTGFMPSKAVALAAIVAQLIGCSQAITVETDFPKPVIEPLPLKAGLRYDEGLTGYRYVEELANDGTWSFDLGNANRALFDTVFESLFRETVAVSAIDAADEEQPDIDVIIEPGVETMEFSLPRQSQTDQYGVWISYNLAIYEPAGDLIIKWPVKGYGQSDSRTFSADKSMEQATIQAMRDAAAIITLGFSDQPLVKKALLENGDDTDNEQNAPD